MEPSEALVAQHVAGIEVAYWNPVRADDTGRMRNVDNVGDLLGPLVVELMLAAEGVPAAIENRSRARLLTIGSVVHLAQDGDVIWGSGANGKALGGTPRGTQLDIRAVRGPWTAAELTSHGYEVPAVYGDPGLLLGRLMPEVPRFPKLEGLRLVVPNLNEVSAYRALGPELARLGLTLLRPEMPIIHVLSAIAHAELVVGSSLHAIVLADAYGVPARFIRSNVEPEFKYMDYLLGSGRPGTTIASGLDDAIALGGHEPPEFDGDQLVQAFPSELWSSTPQATAAESQQFDAPREVVTVWRDRATGRVHREELARWFTTAAERALVEHDSSAETASWLSSARRLVVPDVPRSAFGPHVGALAHAIDHDREAYALRLLEKGRFDESATLRKSRFLGNASLFSFDVELGRAVDSDTTLELVIAREGAKLLEEPVTVFEANHGQVKLEVDVLVPITELGAQDDLYVRVRDNDNGERLVPVASPSDRAELSLSGSAR